MCNDSAFNGIVVSEMGDAHDCTGLLKLGRRWMEIKK